MKTQAGLDSRAKSSSVYTSQEGPCSSPIYELWTGLPLSLGRNGLLLLPRLPQAYLCHTHYILQFHTSYLKLYNTHSLHRDAKAWFLVALSSSVKCDLKLSSFHLQLGWALPRHPSSGCWNQDFLRYRTSSLWLNIETLPLEYNVSYVDSGRGEMCMQIPKNRWFQ